MLTFFSNFFCGTNQNANFPVSQEFFLFEVRGNPPLQSAILQIDLKKCYIFTLQFVK